MDFCLHCVLRKGRNAIDRFFAATPPPADSAEYRFLQAQRYSWFTILQIKDIERDVGAGVRDLLRDQKHFLIDRNLSRSAQAGLTLATRVLPFGDYVTTSGTPLPLMKVDVLKRSANRLKKVFHGACCVQPRLADLPRRTGILRCLMITPTGPGQSPRLIQRSSLPCSQR